MLKIHPYEVCLQLAAEMALDEALRQNRIDRLRTAIDEALDARDAEAFHWLASQLKEEADHAGG